jgi:hypothetical protein
MENLMDWVHDTVDRQCDRVHAGPAGAMDAGNGGASLGRGTRALADTNAHRR